MPGINFDNIINNHGSPIYILNLFNKKQHIKPRSLRRYALQNTTIENLHKLCNSYSGAFDRTYSSFPTEDILDWDEGDLEDFRLCFLDEERIYK